MVVGRDLPNHYHLLLLLEAVVRVVEVGLLRVGK